MFLESLEAENFRNINGKILPEKGLNIIFGANGHGKTNWLEAIFILANSKSFKTTKLIEAIKFGEQTAIVKGNVRQSVEIARNLQVILEGNTKTLTVNNKKETAANFITQLHALLFNSDRLEIVRGTPLARRKFLDDGIISIFPAFVQTLADYKRVIKQKNSLLQTAIDREFSLEKVKEAIEPWNQQLVVLATKIHKARFRYIERLNNVLEKKLFDKEEVSIRYLSSLEGKGDLSDYAALLTERLDLRIQAELYSGYALLGTHRDDLKIKFDGQDLRKYGSSGQQRSALLILEIANLSVFHEQHNEYPVFLLDDIDAELDYKRIGKLLDYLNNKSQTFVTTSKESFVERFSKNATVITINNGIITM